MNVRNDVLLAPRSAYVPLANSKPCLLCSAQNAVFKTPEAGASCALASSRQDATELDGVEAMLLGLTGAALDVGTTQGTVENEHEGAAVPAASIGNHIGDGLDRHSNP
jgi:hypothetical protein